ncbi:MAG: leucyl aminopeptidase family protein [Caulobacteraceae bacterium]
MPKAVPRSPRRATPVSLIGAAAWPAFLEAAPEVAAAAALARFRGDVGQLVLVPDSIGGVARALFGLGPEEGSGPMALRGLAARLPPGDYAIERPPPGFDPAAMSLAWALGTWRFGRYKKPPSEGPARLMPDLAGPTAAACALARDLVATPANDMGPAQFEAAVRALAARHGAAVEVVAGEALIAAGYPAVHAVGRAAVAARAPRMIEMSWGEAGAPLVAIVGKGVVFDTGGLDIKPSAGMRWMKKDMGGAAHALALSAMVMAARLHVRLIVLTPVVENAIAGDAMRPGDVLASRKGLSIEVGNTDAEGRLILADALARAGELSPDLTVDLATLTGAARIALGPEIVPFYTADDALAAALSDAALRVEDPLWRMPLWDGYDAAIDSDIADVRNDADPWAQAGSMTAALFLRRFAPPGAWVHFDLFAWNARARPGWPAGAEVQAIRAIFAVLKDRYG